MPVIILLYPSWLINDRKVPVPGMMPSTYQTLLMGRDTLPLGLPP
jgi:hypothetical protein